MTHSKTLQLNSRSHHSNIFKHLVAFIVVFIVVEMNAIYGLSKKSIWNKKAFYDSFGVVPENSSNQIQC